MQCAAVTDGWPAGWVTEADQRRFARYAEALAFYEGTQWSGKRRPGEPRLTFNYARTLVRKVASYVFPAPVTFSVPAPADAGLEAAARRAELALAEALAANDAARLDVELCVDAAVLGDAALKVTWDATRGEPVIVGVDPATLVARCEPDNPRRIESIVQAYGMSGSAVARAFGPIMASSALAGLAPERVYRVVETWTPSRWTVEIAGQLVREGPNPYGWIPYVVIPNNPRSHAFWGESDLADLYDVCRELNARMSVVSRVLELSGAPIAVLENVDGSEGITVGPGAKWELPEGAKAYLLDLLSGGGVQLHIDYINVLYRALHDLSETPRTAFGDSGRVLSGAALEVEVQPLVQKVQRKRRAWEAAFRERNARVLDLLERFGGLDLGGLRRTVTIWPNVLPSDTESAVRNAARLVSAGIHSRRTAVAALGGDDPEGELDRVLEEMRALAAIAGDGRAGEGA
ncbi:MAG TPA: phage portal protein [Thermomicrobiales bacterium]